MKPHINRLAHHALLIGLVLAGRFLIPYSGFSESGAILEIGKFSAAQEGNTFPDGWKPLTFEKISEQTSYSLVKNQETVVVKAVSERAASGLIREISIDPKEYPIVQWRWKVTNILKKGDVTKKDGDDYPARVYITFEYDVDQLGFFEETLLEGLRLYYGQYPPRALNYIWDSKSPVGTIVPSPYTDFSHMIVTESGNAKVNQWVTEERNVYEDYKKAFGEEPLNITGVAIMTDTDNTGEAATAYFGDIIFKQDRSSS